MTTRSFVECSAESRARRSQCNETFRHVQKHGNVSGPSWLWSIEGSGITWLRILLELGTQATTSSLYRGDGSEGRFFCRPGEISSLCADRQMLGFKAHGPKVPALMLCKAPLLRVVILMRCPGDAIWSEWQRRRARGIQNCLGARPCHMNAMHSAKVSRPPLSLSHWTRDAQKLGVDWNVTATAQLKHASSAAATETVLFEHLTSTQTRVAALTRVAAFAGFPMSEARARCAFEHSDLARRSKNAPCGEWISRQWVPGALCAADAAEAFSLADAQLLPTSAPLPPKLNRNSPPRNLSISAYVWETVGDAASAAGYSSLFKLSTDS